jgi:hypothetical protein
MRLRFLLAFIFAAFAIIRFAAEDSMPQLIVRFGTWETR